MSVSYKRAKSGLGLSAQWDGDDRDAVTAHHRALFRRLKRGYRGSLAAFPGFIDSVQSLYDQGYSFTDIGVFFGVTRERVRQWFGKYRGLTEDDDRSRGSVLRLWDDEQKQFVAASEDDVIAAYEVKKEATQEQHIESIRSRHVQELLRIYRRTGVVPAVYDDDVVEAIGYPGEHGRFWGYPDVSYTDAHDRLWEAAGFDSRPDGRAHGRGGAARALAAMDVAAADRMYASGQSIRDVADHFGVSSRTMWCALNRKRAYSDISP